MQGSDEDTGKVWNVVWREKGLFGLTLNTPKARRLIAERCGFSFDSRDYLTCKRIRFKPIFLKQDRVYRYKSFGRYQ